MERTVEFWMYEFVQDDSCEDPEEVDVEDMEVDRYL